MQPTYFPWAGYLNLMQQVDCFVYLDDAQFERSSWHNRNRILLNGLPNWLTVPVLRGHLGASIQEVEVDDSAPWRRKHLTMLSNAYARHGSVQEMLEATEPLSTTSITHLSNLNITLLEVLRSKLGINTPVIKSSSLDIPGMRTQRLIDILTKLGATDYVTPPGALQYLQEDKFADSCSVHLWVHDFQATEYQQRSVQPFVSHLSILDVVANLGWAGTRNYIRPQSKTVRIY
ncbi:WbqC family protein [Methylophilus sp. UBA6697]|jgi:hypothetical protein|uniref:WbqC family protein n=1 Tax=Methylophilus sp. UBA6697 TaxID=1946902 RepID=UPI0025E9E23D|nr:WbqC family protein [Methylophilus sp. UBA6697]